MPAALEGYSRPAVSTVAQCRQPDGWGGGHAVPAALQFANLRRRPSVPPGLSREACREDRRPVVATTARREAVRCAPQQGIRSRGRPADILLVRPRARRLYASGRPGRGRASRSPTRGSRLDADIVGGRPILSAAISTTTHGRRSREAMIGPPFLDRPAEPVRPREAETAPNSQHPRRQEAGPARAIAGSAAQHREGSARRPGRSQNVPPLAASWCRRWASPRSSRGRRLPPANAGKRDRTVLLHAELAEGLRAFKALRPPFRADLARIDADLAEEMDYASAPS